MTDPLQSIDDRLQNDGTAVDLPEIHSFRQFLEEHAYVKAGSEYVRYSFDGREVLSFVVDLIDNILGSHTGEVIQDATLAVCGGAQFGKTILALHLKAYVTGVLFRNAMYYLPDDDLVQGIVDTKDRPDVIDQIPWYAELTTVGKGINASGRQVNRKGGFMVTDGKRSAQAYVRGMGKIPTSFSADVVIEDEKDDIPPAKSKFLKGRMTNSSIRFQMSIGTQRYHGAGQNKEFEDGTQHVGILECPDCHQKLNPEEAWPQICRIAMDGIANPNDPQLTLEGDFKSAGSDETAAGFDHEATYYFACTTCGAELDRNAITFVARRPERAKMRRWSVRSSQFGSSAIDLIQIVADWCENAVKDPECMIAFSCDRSAMPKSTMQSLTPQILQRARSGEEYTLSLKGRDGTVRYGGMDTGDRCFFFVREIESPLVKRMLWAEQVSTERARQRIPALFHTLGLSCLFIDIGAERNLTRDLCFALNGNGEFQLPAHIDTPERAIIKFGNGMEWNGEKGYWSGIRCGAVEFSLKPGKGIVQKLGITQEAKFYPVIQCNRDETIQRVINEFLTAEEGLVEVIDNKMRTEPVFRLPSKRPGAQAIIETFDQHLLAGSRKVKDKDGKESHFVDKLENHLLLADAYSSLAEMVLGVARNTNPATMKRFIPDRRSKARRSRNKRVLAG